MKDMGHEDVRIDKYGHVKATLPPTTSRENPTIGLIANMDTSPDVSG